MLRDWKLHTRNDHAFRTETDVVVIISSFVLGSSGGRFCVFGQAILGLLVSYLRPFSQIMG